MTLYPRLELSLSAVRANTGALAERLLAAGIELVGVTKAVDGEHVYLAVDGCAVFVRDAGGTVRSEPEPFPEDLGREFDAAIAAAGREAAAD